AVLGICCTTNLLVVAGSTKRRSDGHSFTEVVANFLQNIDQVRINKDWIGVVLATKLSNTKVIREALGSVFCVRVSIDSHRVSILLRCSYSDQENSILNYSLGLMAAFLSEIALLSLSYSSSENLCAIKWA